MQYIKNYGNVKNLFRGSNLDSGFYAWIEENGELTIGEEKGREGGILYRDIYKGKCTPYMDEIKKENATLYTSIVRYFREHENDHKNAVMCSTTMTDMKKLNEIFNDKQAITEHEEEVLIEALSHYASYCRDMYRRLHANRCEDVASEYWNNWFTAGLLGDKILNMLKR